MAEQEIIKHTKKTYSIMKSGEATTKEKFKEILIEILIIVFAVSVSIALHNWSEKNHNKEEEKEFLLGLKKDLEANALNMKSSLAFYEENLRGINYFLQAESAGALNQDSINAHRGIFFNSTELEPHIGRYEGFKSMFRIPLIGCERQIFFCTSPKNFNIALLCRNFWTRSERKFAHSRSIMKI